MGMSEDIKKSKNIFYVVLHSLFPTKVTAGTHIVKHVKETRIMYAYKFIFVYPFCLIVGINLLFLMIALLPGLPIGFIVFLALHRDFEHLYAFIEYCVGWALKLAVPILVLKLFDCCILKGDTTQILSSRYIRCFWLITWI